MTETPRVCRGDAPAYQGRDEAAAVGEAPTACAAALVAVDAATTWTELQAIWGLHHQRVTGGIRPSISCPSPLRAWHSDNGSEFINHCRLGWCRRYGVRFTRGRPYRGERSGLGRAAQRSLVVRRLVGYDRYSSRAAQTVLQRLYGLLRLQLYSFFRPVRKLRRKRRVGSHVR